MGTCGQCHGVLEPLYPDDIAARLTGIEPGRGLDRYRPLLPTRWPIPYLGEGDTPLLPSRSIGPKLGLKGLVFKHEGLNPSGAFKDRTGAMAVALAQDAGAGGVLTASSGNASSAIAAYCAAAGLECVVLLEPGNPPAKLRQTLAAGARVIPVEGIFSRGPQAVSQLMLDVSRRTGLYLGFVWAPVNPYILEGIKTISYEIAARLPGAPGAVLSPVGGGDLLAAQWRGYRDLGRAGLLARSPRMIAVQSVAAPPLLEAFRRGLDRVPTLPAAASKISGVNVPFSGDHALAAVRESQGLTVGVSDEEVFHMQRRLATEEGIWVEPAGALPVAALQQLVDQGRIDPEERVVCILSGAGFKDTTLASDEVEALARQPAAPFEAGAIARLCS